MLVHSTFYRKVGLKRAGVEGGGARSNTMRDRNKDAAKLACNKITCVTPVPTSSHYICLLGDSNRRRSNSFAKTYLERACI